MPFRYFYTDEIQEKMETKGGVFWNQMVDSIPLPFISEMNLRARLGVGAGRRNIMHDPSR